MMSTENINDTLREMVSQTQTDELLHKSFINPIKNEAIRLEKEELKKQILSCQEERMNILRQQVSNLERELELKRTLENIVANGGKIVNNKTLLNE